VRGDRSRSNVFAGYLPEAGARHVFAENATMFARPAPVDVKGGWQGDGPLVVHEQLPAQCMGWSRCHRAPRRRVEPLPRVVFVPLAELTVEDTWNARGLRGDGKPPRFRGRPSWSISIHSCRFSDRAWPDGTLWRLPSTRCLSLVGGGSDRHRRGAPRRSLPSGPRGSQRTARAVERRPDRHGRTHHRDTDLRAIRAALLDALDEAHACAERGDPVNRQLQPGSCSPRCGSCDVAVEVTSIAHALGGAAAVYAGSRLLRALLDVQTGRQHQLFGHQHDRRSAPRWPGGTSRIRHSSCRPTSRIAQVKAAGCKVISSATTVEEARWLEQRGVDAVIAQGYEAVDIGACSSTATATARSLCKSEQWPWFRKSPIPSACR